MDSSCTTLAEVLVGQATRNADSVAFSLIKDGRAGVRSARDLTYGELAARALQAAARLKERGLARGARVVICLPTSEELLVAVYGTMLAGGVCVPVYPPAAGQHTERWRRLVSTVVRVVQPSGAVVSPRLRLPVSAVLEQLGEERFVVTPQHLRGAGSERPEALSDADLALIQFTSGTTRHPRGVAVSHGALIANIEAISRVMPLSSSDRSVSWLPPYHDMGLVGHIFKPVHCGVRQYLMKPAHFWRQPASWLRLLSETGATETTAPDSAYAICAHKVTPGECSGLDLSGLRWALNGAEMVRPRTLRRFAEAFGPYGFAARAFRPVYGLAEATLAVTFGGEEQGPRVDRVRREPLAERGVAARCEPHAAGGVSFVGVGRPLPGHEIRVVDPQRGVCRRPREVGEVWVKGPSVTRGYFNDPQATIELLAEGWLRTGDLGYLAEGELFVTGRRKDVIIYRGHNYHPEDLEQACLDVDGLRRGRAVAFGAVDPRRPGDAGERLVLVAEVQRGVARERALAQRVAAAVARATGIRPDQVELVEPGVLPKTTSGKLQRGEVKQAFEAGRRLRANRRVLLGRGLEARVRSMAELASTRARRLLGWR